MSASVTAGNGVADAQRCQRLGERVHAVGEPRRALDPAAGRRLEHARAGLDRGALQVVVHAAQAAHLLAAAGAARSAVDEHRQGRAVAGGFGCRIGIQDKQPAVPGGGTEHDLAGELGIVGDD
jgi:hypothetical protein